MCVIATCCDRDQYNLLNLICTLERAEVRRAPSSPAAWRLFNVCACVHVIGLSGKERKCLPTSALAQASKPPKQSVDAPQAL